MTQQDLKEMKYSWNYGCVELPDKRKLQPQGKFVLEDNLHYLGWEFIVVGFFYLIGVTTFFILIMFLLIK